LVTIASKRYWKVAAVSPGTRAAPLAATLSGPGATAPLGRRRVRAGAGVGTGGLGVTVCPLLVT
jgi:hypothetical protein